MPPQGPGGNADDAGNERHYPLYFVEGPAGFYWRLPNSGVTVSGARIAWTADGIDRDYGLDEIRSIRLQHAGSGGRKAIGLCQIRFIDGRVVTIYGGSDRGLSDPAQRKAYSAFVRDLHARIPEAAAQHIIFNAGVTNGRFAVMSVAVGAGALLFIGTPLIFMFMVPSGERMKVAALLAGSAFFCWPLWKLWENNQPRHYSPRDLPEDLVG